MRGVRTYAGSFPGKADMGALCTALFPSSGGLCDDGLSHRATLDGTVSFPEGLVERAVHGRGCNARKATATGPCQLAWSI